MDFQNITYNSTVKEESCSKLCYGCLSSDRNLTDLGEYTAPFLTLLGRDSLTSSLQIALCWECSAMLRKMRLFQQRVQHAHSILLQGYHGDHISLSTITKVNLHLEDTILNIEEETENTITRYEPMKQETCKEYQPVVVMTDLKIELEDELNIKSEEENDSVYKPDNSGIEYEPEENKNLTQLETNTKTNQQYTKLKVKKQISNHTLYSTNGTLVENKNLDFENYEKNFTDICLSEADMGSLSLGKTRRRVHQSEVKCRSCRLVFDNETFLNMHNTFYHLTSTCEKKSGYECIVCKKVLCDIASLREHWMTHSEAAKCNICGFTVHRKSKRQHLDAHKYYWKCKHCDDAILHSSFHLNYHYETLHMRSICDCCNREFPTKNKLATHIRVNHLPCKCQKCGKIFKKYKNLKQHIKHVHEATVSESVFCVECNKQFSRKYGYLEHLKHTKKHNPANEWPCPECGKEFSVERRMMDHYNFMHKGVTNYQCKICHKYLYNSSRLSVHTKTVHLKIKPPKNKLCNICGRGFGDNKTLKNHMQTHTGERPYKCRQCPAAFSQRHPLVMHIKKQHNVLDPSSILSTRP